MAGEDDSKPNQTTNNHNSQRGPEDDNPFVAFRRYADEQISSMLQSVMGLPSMASPPSSSHWDVFANDHRFNDPNTRQRQNGDGSEGEYPTGSGAGDQTQGSTSNNDKPSSTSSRSRWSEFESPWHTHHHHYGWHHNSGPIDLFGLDSFFNRSWFDDHLPSAFRLFHPHHLLFPDMWDEEMPGWPVTYLMFSPYSPLQLERNRGHHNRGVFSSIMSSLSASDRDSSQDPAEPQWREAFEDLLRLENGKPMLDREPAAASRKETPKGWLEGLVKRGSLGDQWKLNPVADENSSIMNGRMAFGKSDDRESSRDVKEPKDIADVESTADEKDLGAMTELDMYERFLQDVESREREFSREFSASPMLRFLLEDRQRYKDELAEYKRKGTSAEDADTEKWLELASGGNNNSVSEVAAQQTALNPSSSEASVSQPQVISTRTSTERIRLGDGSVKTRTVQTKRFADGREESNESVDVVNPSQQSSDSANQDEPAKNGDKSGWFWKNE
ncbi:hypothetical protein ASPWEDRAFT_115517 [Aspergillus wentii DTO 134E9]|uniref:Uncharacterized protein n=1 Tax=Aspergillus wentii DTO 134E9 TaxID=1073089 RepID=A0A1L9RDG2_ASPWE|nr:uncharacterized protein ASPWEDRAFT_115517 [Aspergillus wentii DTO 134E9]KAI9933260.1 hypothetical protein MW887_007733 [Aspergillus wentii]OJJ32989.1 hypothetical protein ASPWEDRAFT_115517 [Aspergillus wentii DTO 134E9]